MSLTVTHTFEDRGPTSLGSLTIAKAQPTWTTSRRVQTRMRTSRIHCQIPRAGSEIQHRNTNAVHPARSISDGESEPAQLPLKSKW